MADVRHCPDRDDLQRFLVGRLPETDAERLQEHLADCPSCLDTLHGLEAKDTLIEVMRAQGKAPPRSEDAVVQGLVEYLSGLGPPLAGEAAATIDQPAVPTRRIGPEDCKFLAPAEAPDEIGRLGGYRVLRILGGGDMGVVLEAEDPRLKRRVALKVMNPDLASNDVARKRFLREAQAVAALEHDHIIAIHEVDEDRGVPFLAMPLLKGETLEDRLRRQGSGAGLFSCDATAERGVQGAGVGGQRSGGKGLPLAETLRIGREIAEGLAAAHAAGLTHRDIKPANVFLEQSRGTPALAVPRVKILDFGLARPAEDDLHLTASGTIAGTPSYMAPEQAEGTPVDHRCDVFSLGAVLYRMATGELPFPGTGAVAVLRAVALEQPAPPRIRNPELPADVAALIMRLLAKDPAKRPAGARQVADTLAGMERAHAARLIGPAPAPRWRRLALAAAATMLVAALGAMSYFGPMLVYRFATNQGQLVIDSYDKDVEITVKQNGARIEIVDKQTGHQVTLKAGDYDLEITKGEPGLTLKTRQFTLTRGSTTIVEVLFDPAVAKAAAAQRQPAQPAPPPPPTPFVIVARDGKTETRHAALADAVAAARSGDIIEIRGDGPFECPPLKVTGKPLVVRAAAGFQPILEFGAEGLGPRGISWETDAPLALEGLELRRRGVDDGPHGTKFLLFVQQGPLHATHCRFLAAGKRRVVAVGLNFPRAAELRNCLFVGDLQSSVSCWAIKPGSLVMDNCVAASLHGAVFPDGSGSTIRLTRSTFVGWTPVSVFPIEIKEGAKHPALAEQPVRVESSDNVLDVTAAASIHLSDDQAGRAAADWQASLRRLLAFQELRNVYRPNQLWPALQQSNRPAQPIFKTPKEWQELWGLGAGPVQGAFTYQGGDIAKRNAAAPESLTAADFRLQPKSAGQGAGENGGDLGADVDKVGPGKAYEAWKKSPEREPWLAATGQSTPFVVLSPGVKTERKFSGLAEAAAAAKSGDVIEIRGNGPFETPAINIGKALVIRGGAGFEPVLQPDLASVGLNAPLLNSWGPLVLEGLHFRHVEELPRDQGYTVIQSWNAPLSVTHCRFFLKSSRHLSAFNIGRSPRTEVRHCEFAGNFTIALNWGSLASFHHLEVSDCLNWGASHFVVTYHHPPEVAREIVVRLERNTCVGHGALQHYYTRLDAASMPDVKPFHVEARDNVFDTSFLLAMTVPAPGKFQPATDRPLVPRSFTWKESKNVYTGSLLNLVHHAPPKSLNVPVIKEIDEWRGYWGLGDTTGSVQGRLRYHGANVRAARAATPETLAAADFRLHRDSDGKGAGAAGRDLGADVDKLGPGKAYHEWKKSPAYVRWLDATGQVLDPEPFVVLATGGKREFKFDKLTSAIDFAQSGDVIEIRGNGPYVTPALSIDKRDLVIRAGAGFEPVLQLDAKSLAANAPLLVTHGALVLEGLHIRHIEEPAMKLPYYTLIQSNNAPLAVTHCRFFIKSQRNLNTLLCDRGPRVHVSHCEFAGASNNAVTWNLPAVGELEAADNLCWGSNNLVYFAQNPPVAARDIAVRLARNTFLGPIAVLHHQRQLPDLLADQGEKAFRIDVRENLFDADRVYLAVYTDKDPFEPESLRPLLPRLVAWSEKKNLYRDATLLSLGQYAVKTVEAIKRLDEWHAYWGIKDADIVFGPPRYQGGDVRVLKAKTPERFTAGDFRLHPESPGKGAGDKGRDLGAAVELVGPGPAYEYWKRSPEYVLWLKATQQVR